MFDPEMLLYEWKLWMKCIVMLCFCQLTNVENSVWESQSGAKIYKSYKNMDLTKLLKPLVWDILTVQFNNLFLFVYCSDNIECALSYDIISQVIILISIINIPTYVTLHLFKSWAQYQEDKKD